MQEKRKIKQIMKLKKYWNNFKHKINNKFDPHII